MNNNNYYNNGYRPPAPPPGRYGQYQPPPPMYQRPAPKPPKRKGAPIALVVVLAMLFGFVGGSAAMLLFRAESMADFAAAMLPYSPPPATEPTAAPAEPAEAEPAPTAPTEPPPMPSAGSIAEKVAAAAGPSVVEVNTESKVTHPFFGSYITGGAGSGVILSPDGLIVTNHHVIEGSDAVSIRLSDGTEYPAALIGDDRQTDLALLKIEAEGLAAAAFADSDEVAVGQPVVAIGNPLGSLGGTVTEGIISAKDREIVIGEDEMTLLQTSAAINPGNSGGGLFDGEGLLVGVVNAKSAGEDIEGLGFAIPANTVEFVVAELRENGFVTGRPSLGVEAVEISTLDELYYYGVSDYGLYVLSASGAEHPLKNGDRLLRVGGEDISVEADLRRAISGLVPGDTVAVAFQRGGQLYQADVVLTEIIE